MAKIAHIYGVLRSADLATKTGTNEVFGVRGSILSEPEGDTIDVLAFSREVDSQSLLAMKGQGVHAVVTLDVTAGRNGAAFLNVNLRKIEPWSPPSAAPAPVPAPAAVSHEAAA